MGFFTYLKIGALIAALAVGAGGVWWVQGVRLDKKNAEITVLKAEVVSYKRVKEIYENDIELDKELETVKEKVKKLTPQEIDAEFDRLRNYGVQPKGGGAKNPDDNP